MNIRPNDIIAIHRDARCVPDLRGKLARVVEVKEAGVKAEVIMALGKYSVRLDHEDYDFLCKGAEE